MKLTVLVKLFLLCVLWHIPAEATPLRVSDFAYFHLGLAEGLLNQRVSSLRQTADGAVWLTTQHFVARYNGVSIENFYLSDGPEGQALPATGPRFVQTADSLLQVFDGAGRIYAYNEVQNRFDLVADATLKGRPDNAVNDVYREGDTYWLAMSEGIYRYRYGKLSPVAPGVYAHCVIPGPDGLLLIGTRWQGVLALSPRDRRSARPSPASYLPYGAVSGHYDAETRQLWLGTYYEGLFVVDASGRRLPVEGIPRLPVRSIVAYDGQSMLVGVDGGGVYQTARRPQTHPSASLLFNANEGDRGVLHGNGVYALLADHWGNLFVGSYSGGVDMALAISGAVTEYRHQRNNRQTLLNDHVNSVAQLPSSALAMGTDDGVSLYYPQSGEWRHLARGLVVLSLCTKPDGSALVAATYGNCIYEISPRGDVRQLYDTGVLVDNHVHDLLYDRRGHLWIACQDAKLVEAGPDGVRYYPVDNVKSLALLPDGRIAAGTIRGLYVVTPGENGVRELRYYADDPKRACRYILDLYIHDGRYLDIATDGGGLYVYDLAGGKCRQYTVANGLPSNTVTSVVRDDDGRLWLGTAGGLACARPDSLERVVSMNYHYGLRREYSSGAAVTLAGGNLLFGSDAGAVELNPRGVRPYNYRVDLRFRGVYCAESDTEAFRARIARTLSEGKLSLPYSQRTFELYIESIDLRYQPDIAYQYRAGEGTWSPLSEQQYIRFVNLESGTHQLTVRAVSKANRVVLGERQLLVTVHRPWWNSWWMWCIYIALVAALFYGAWWTYGLHVRYIRLVVSTLERDKAEPDTPAPADDDDVPGPENTQNPPFVDAVIQHLQRHLSDSDFTIDHLCREMAMSRTMFYVRLKSYTGKSPQEFIRVVRLERAAVLLRAGRPVGRVAQEVGFDNPKYFSTAFKKYFGISPSKFK